MLYFITGNSNKFRELQAMLPGLKQLQLDLDEVQNLNPQTVIEHKLNQAAAQHDGEFIVEDTSLEIASLGGLPGTFVKWFEQAMGIGGIADMALCYPDRSATARVVIGYRNAAGNISTFTGELRGQIVGEQGTGGFGWDAIFQPEGSKLTLAQMTPSQKQRISMRQSAVRQLIDHLSTTPGTASQI